MKRLTWNAIFLLATLSVAAQSSKSPWSFDAGAGALPTFISDQAQVNIWPVSLQAGYRFSELFELGIYAGLSSSTSATVVEFGSELARYENVHLVTGLRGEFHANRFERVDLYGGFMLAYYRSFVDRIAVDEIGVALPPDPEPSTNKPYAVPEATGKVLPTGFVGAIYFPAERIGLFAELGYAVSLVQVGLHVKLR
ncbi:MAG: hypothetical protein KDC43_24035 [Saprospiraceae bacterium]|nr:hypothetical protein [Saprospiraceae bacterium]MCB0626899.1 hypothetical protein [Saprospiraceae bacterium]MCB0678519.1 hypothetical protein [Saprospiraceae bacterium]MCB0681492.1 hypothetical protein [Saprospiraceae bacterium]